MGLDYPDLHSALKGSSRDLWGVDPLRDALGGVGAGERGRKDGGTVSPPRWRHHAGEIDFAPQDGSLPV